MKEKIKELIKKYSVELAVAKVKLNNEPVFGVITAARLMTEIAEKEFIIADLTKILEE